MVIECLIALASGAMIESACVAWTHYSERGMAASAAWPSMVMATAQAIGLGEFFRDWRVGVFFVLGNGLGTYGAVRFKSRR